ncbi:MULTISPECIES: universal stress protein [Kitasatospora]|uniref:Universal stress protein n=1 Tax=Kitasatospora cystarginea TaxID=58350 RepID=A0ABN3DXL8_9ACTN
MIEKEDHEKRIVVGVDGSEQSRRALRWAIRQARLTHAVVEAVMAWQPPFSGVGSVVSVEQRNQIGEIAQKALAENIEKVAGSEPPVEIRAHAVEGVAAQALLDVAAQGASLLVVGHRGVGGFTGALLGSVGQHCVQHAPCPVVVVRGRDG